MKNQSAEFSTFSDFVTRALSVSHEEIKRREAEYKKVSDANPRKRGPKKKGAAMPPPASPDAGVGA